MVAEGGMLCTKALNYMKQQKKYPTMEEILIKLSGLMVLVFVI